MKIKFSPALPLIRLVLALLPAGAGLSGCDHEKFQHSNFPVVKNDAYYGCPYDTTLPRPDTIGERRWH